jgi:hypothetical protein
MELVDGRADRGQVRCLIGIRRGVFDARRQDALGLSKVGQHDLQDAVGAGVGHRMALGIHGLEGSTNHATSTEPVGGDRPWAVSIVRS